METQEKQETQEEYSLYDDYKEILEKVGHAIMIYGHTTMYDPDFETPESEEMEQILNFVYQILIRAKAVMDDPENLVYIDENHPAWDDYQDKKPYKTLKFAYDSKIDKKILEELEKR